MASVAEAWGANCVWEHSSVLLRFTHQCYTADICCFASVSPILTPLPNSHIHPWLHFGVSIDRKGKYGENIAASIAADTDPVRTATGLWIGEAKDYDYDNPQGGESGWIVCFIEKGLRADPAVWSLRV